MQMQVRDLLTSMLTVVNHNSVAFIQFLYFGDFCNSNHQFAQNFLMSLLSVSDADESIFLFGDDKHVHWCLRVNISEGQDVIILVYHIGGYLFSDDFVEDGFSCLHILRYYQQQCHPNKQSAHSGDIIQYSCLIQCIHSNCLLVISYSSRQWKLVLLLTFIIAAYNKMLKLTTSLAHKFSYAIRSPFDLKLFREQGTRKLITKSLQARFRDVNIVPVVVQQLESHKKNLFELEQVNKSINKIQKQIKELKKKGAKDEKQENSDKQENQQLKRKMADIADMKQKQKKMQEQVKDLTKTIEDRIIKIGNIVDQSSPISKDEANNQVLVTYTPEKGFAQHSVSYSEICQKFGLTDLKRGQKVGGHRGYFLKNGAVKLALALANYGLQFLEKKGYEIYQSPAIITESTLKGSCQLQSIQQDVYKLEGMDSYLIATSEQSLAGLFRDEVLARNKLPVRMAGYSTCFRKQAGAHGKDIHGLFRVHQFEKVEQFTITEPEQSVQEMKRMIQISEQFYKSLELPFRVVNIVSGELNDAASCKFDLQAWYPSQNKYRELVSVSNCTEYQSRLLKIQYQGPNNQNKFPHMLNGTLVAIQRALTCIVENNYENNCITVPKVLQPIAGIDKIELPTNK